MCQLPQDNTNTSDQNTRSVLGPDTPKEQTSAVPAWVIGLMVVLMVLVGGGVAVIMYLRRRRKVSTRGRQHGGVVMFFY